MAEPYKWLALGYNVPINPSRSRVYIWRKLKEFGAEYFKQGVAILPHNKAAMAQFKALAAKIREFGGEATLTELRFLDSRDEQEMVERFRSQSMSDFTELLLDCTRLLEDMRQHREISEALEQNDQLRKMIRRYAKLKSRDHFKAGNQREIDRGLDELAKHLQGAAKEPRNKPD